MPLSAPSRWLRRGLLAAGLLLGVLPARAATPQEYQVKAVFLFNFAQFVEWPATAFAGPNAPLVIGVLGEDPFGSALDDTVRGEIINQRPLVVRRFQRIEEVDHCHILFVSRSESKRLETVVAALRGRTILTVGDTEGFALRGVMIRFITEKNRIRLRINLDAARAAALVISSQLLRPAEIVTTPED
jgi:hypothetical protein